MLFNALFMLMLSSFISLQGQEPEIANIYPDFYVHGHIPRVITGDNFDSQTVVWELRVPTDQGSVLQSADSLEQALPDLPLKPPRGARRLKPLDVEKQVLTVVVPRHYESSILWVQNGKGFSRPFMINAAKPFWVSSSEARQGDLLHIYGFGLRIPYKSTFILLKNEDSAEFVEPIAMPRARRIRDPRLLYFRIPGSAVTGSYTVLVHNSYGGQWGWRSAGRVQVLDGQKAPRRLFNVKEYGAKGDGLSNDARAIKKALTAAKSQAGVVFFPPGTYLTDETIAVPRGVTIRGASRENTIIRGVGYDPREDRRAWFTGANVPGTAVIRLNDHTALESLTVKGATSRGAGGVALVEAVPGRIRFPGGGEVDDLAVRDCRLYPFEDMESGLSPYGRQQAVYFGPRSRRVRFISNEVFGSVLFNGVHRLDMINNRFHGGNVSGSGTDCLIDTNYFVDSPKRFLFYPLRHCHIRFNEVHQASRNTWTNAEEIFLSSRRFQ